MERLYSVWGYSVQTDLHLEHYSRHEFAISCAVLLASQDSFARIVLSSPGLS